MPGGGGVFGFQLFQPEIRSIWACVIGSGVGIARVILVVWIIISKKEIITKNFAHLFLELDFEKLNPVGNLGRTRKTPARDAKRFLKNPNIFEDVSLLLFTLLFLIIISNTSNPAVEAARRAVVYREKIHYFFLLK